MPRHVVLEGADAATAQALAARDGAHLAHVGDSRAAAQAVLAAVRGADLVVLATATREVIDQLCDDLRRLGEVDHRVGAAPRGPQLSPDERALLAELVHGHTLGQAARALHLSRRTADRRLASARRALGASTTSEALVVARRLGIVAPDG